MDLRLDPLELPLRIRPERPMTDEELLRFCAGNELARIEREASGELIVMSPGGSEGGGVETDVTLELGLWARQDGRGRVFGSNAGFTLPDESVRAADAHWVSWPRWNSLSAADRRGFAPICPEFVIEVRLENDSLPKLQEKMRMWLANGAELAWLIDPSHKAVEIYRAGAGAGLEARAPELLEDGSSIEGEGPVAGFVLELARIWS